ncbi:fatty acyl-AMP ligase [Streptomyces sp. NPDC051576]|uniref:fatty acyl-AMP ligase n=1 Tax=Streptomyces sp. NPDC051576 TaxID=3155803 RepID=UPI00341CF224
MSRNPAESRGLGELVLRHARATPDKPAFVLVTDVKADASDIMTYGELATRALRRLRGLTAEPGLSQGDRVVLALPTGPEFVELYVACLMGGLVAVPVPVPGSSRDAGHRFAGIVRDCRAGLVLTTEQDLREVRAALAKTGQEHQCRAIMPLPEDDTDPTARPVVEDGDVAVLQYTSGSISDPKGVMISHANITRNARAFADALGLGPADRLGGWAPLHHDMGLFLLLSTSLTLGGTCVLMSPLSFLKRPKDWLRMVDRHRITVTAAPSFAFELCLRTFSDADLDSVDLNRLRYVLNGAEPIVESVMNAFMERFRRAGFNPRAMTPGYGLAESTVFVTCKAPESLPQEFRADPDAFQRGELRSAEKNGTPLVGCGFPGDLELRIADPETGEEVAAQRIGEIWLRGPSVGLGYWNRPDDTEHTFRAATAVAADGSDWLRTGDLGSVVDDELYVTGRLKELLIVRGRNIYPQDIEAEARASHPALTGLIGSAFSVPDATEERPVVVHEVHPRTAAEEFPAVAAAVRERLFSRLGLALGDIVLVRRGSVRRTTSGKIQRLAMRDRFLRGELARQYAESDTGTPAPGSSAERAMADLGNA